jgi:hypothetical protein
MSKPCTANEGSMPRERTKTPSAPEARRAGRCAAGRPRDACGCAPGTASRAPTRPAGERVSALRAPVELAARRLQHAAVGNAGGTHRLACAAVEAVVEVLDQRVAGRDAALASPRMR